MKFTALAKATLALGILTTGTLATEAHSSHAKQNQETVNTTRKHYTDTTLERLWN